jgi:hypothetical protein
MNTPYDNASPTPIDEAQVAIHTSATPKAGWAGTEAYVKVTQDMGGVVQVTNPAQWVHVRIEGPHTRLQPADVAACYPTDGSNASAPEFLPHIALTRRTLPWERAGVKANLPNDVGEKVTPWLAVLLLAEDEIIDVGDKQIRSVQISPKLQQEEPALYTLLTGGNGTDGKGTNYRYANGDNVDVVRAPLDLVQRILPQRDELALLCHVQKLSPGNLVEQDDPNPMWTRDPDHCVAIVIGNRLPNPDPKPKKYVACLVSIENREDLFEPLAPAAPPLKLNLNLAASVSASPPTAIAKPAASAGGGIPLGPIVIRTTDLVVLQSWRFTPDPLGDFKQIVDSIRWAPNGGVMQFGFAPSLRVDGPQALAIDGALELDHKQGGKVRYAGPLSMSSPKPRSNDCALHAPTAVGNPADVSYAAAFELGRLLALHDDGVLSDLQEVRLLISGPATGSIYATNPLPKALQKLDWGVNPVLAQVSLPSTQADPSGVQQISQAERAQLLQPSAQVGLVGVQAVGVLLDLDQIVGVDLDAQFSHIVNQRRG